MTRGVRPALSLARRHRGRRRDRHAALLQAAGAADLARRGGHGARRRAVAVRPAPARRRAEAGARAESRHAAGGVGAMRRLALARCSVALLAPGAALCGAAGRDPEGPGARGARAALSQELRCMVCQNQSIDDSDAPLAHDLRVLVRERLKAGDSDAAGARLHRRALRRFRAAQAAVRARHAAAVGGCRRPC